MSESKFEEMERRLAEYETQSQEPEVDWEQLLRRDPLRALEEAIENFAGCVLLISHDRWFIDRLATHILSFEGDSDVQFFEGNFSDYEKNKRARLGDVTPKRPRFKNVINK